MNNLAKTLRKYFTQYQIIIPLIIFIVIQLQYINLVPIWDGGWYMTLLYDAMEKTFSLNNYSLSKHPAFIYAFFIAITQWIDFGNVQLFHILQIIIGCIGIFSFYKIMQFVFGEKYRIEALLVTFIFAIHPTFLANSLFPTLDFPVTCFLMATFAAFLYERYVLFLIFAIFSIFTRETGISFYGIFVAAYSVIFITRRKNIFKKNNFKKLIIFSIPVIAFLIFGLYKNGISADGGGGVFWGQKSSSYLNLFLRFDLTNPFTVTPILHVFYINFNWIFSLFILLYLGGRGFLKLLSFIFNRKITYPHGPIQINKNYLYIFLCTFIVNAIILFNYITFTNIRYRLPLIPLFLILGTYCFLVILQNNKKLRIALLIGMIPLFFIQNFYTIDKPSKSVMNTFKFGKHDILCMTSITKEVKDCGRDQRTYNLQYANMVPLFNKAIQKMNLNEDVNIISNLHTHFFAIKNIDKRTKEITLRKPNENIITANLYSFDRSRPHSPSTVIKRMEKSELPDRFYYLDLPVWSQPYYELMRLGQKGYVKKEEYTLEHNGYTIGMTVLEQES